MIFQWWQTHRRDLPWRQTNDPYKILISEVMLQQTQVRRVLPKYTEFIKLYPTVQSLATASQGDILRVWKGMGYNRRALYLQKTAQEVVQQFGGVFPKELSLLTKLPGVGTYTARAILVFAYKQHVAMVDTNIRQIITHLFFEDIPQKPSVIQEVADKLVPSGKSWEWHQALMDYGALELSKLKLPKLHRKSSIPFKQSDRYVRGRIMDLLREQSFGENELMQTMEKTYKKSNDKIHRILAGLLKDGLIIKKKSRIQLPE